MNPKYKKPYRARRKRAPKPKPATPRFSVAQVKSLVKREMNKVIEFKHADYQFEPIPSSALYHNTWYLMESDPLTLLQGVQDNETVNPPNRIGDSVYSKGIKLNMLFYLFNDRPNQALRILILKVKPDTTGVGNPCNHPQAVSNIIMPVDTENSRYQAVVYDRVFVFNNNVSNIAAGVIRDVKFHWQHYIKIDKKTNYEDGFNSARNYTYNIWVCAYDTVNSFTTDNIARFSYSRRHIFQDA